MEKCVKKHVIDIIEEGSIAEELGVEPGDILVSINGNPINDVFDYHFLINDDELDIQIQKPNGEIWDLEIEKDYYEDLGIVFENGLMDDYRSCYNKCIFCFIDQMPPGMRDTLYFKDDDSRLSFLQGNYVTLTNMSDDDVDRIIRYKLAPINVSVHTTNPELRCKMLNNRFAGQSLEKIKKFYDAGIEMNGQIVLCKGINDGDELERTISDLSEYLPYFNSLSVVPVGLTKFREGLYPLESFEKEDAKKVIKIIQKWQDICYEKHGNHFVQASDEWFLLAEEDFPEEEVYDGYVQLENGVGMIPLLRNEFRDAMQFALEDADAGIAKTKETVISVATARLAYPTIKALADEFMANFQTVKINVYEIINNFFGEKITVSGLLTAADLKEQLSDKCLGEKLLLPCNLLRSGEEVFLDDVTLDELSEALGVEIHIVGSDGQCLFDEFFESI